MTLFKYAFNLISPPVRLYARVDEDGHFLLYLPGASYPIRVAREFPVDLRIDTTGPSGPVTLTAERGPITTASG